MTLKHSFKTAIGGLRKNKGRSGLTILGIVIGITAIIIVMSLGNAAQNLILSQIQGLGSKTIVVIPGRQPKGPFDVAQNLFGDSLKEKELMALSSKANVQNVDKIMPLVIGSGVANYQGEIYRLTIAGATELLADIWDIYPSEGTFINDDDIKSKSDVIVIGPKVKEELFGSSDALNQKIKMNNRNFRVIGVLPKKGQAALFNFDEMAIIPYTTAQQYVFGIKHFHRIVLEASSEEAIPQIVRDVELTIRNLHNITDPEKDDFHVETQAGIMQTVGVITGVLTLFLIAVAAISLLVGGIGIMNIMLVSVTERTREIGLRKAIGATEKNILNQFLLEAIILTATGGIVGIILGAGISFLITIILGKIMALGWSYSFPIMGTLIGLAISALIGLIFGIYPARQAAKKSPIEALRYE